MLRQQNGWLQAAERYASRSCSLPKEKRMGEMDMVILILKLIVALLQLLEAVLKLLR